MIPLRVKLTNFLNHKETELAFDGEGLWILSGHNGSGKSAVFDAITFALYGEHRGGKQNADDLINHHHDKMGVEFEFRLGDDIFVVRRTVERPKSGKTAPTTTQAWWLSGSNPPQPGRIGKHAVPDTHKARGFSAWVERTIGLRAETFLASVVLRQGKADALLDATSTQRHDMIGQFIDLSEYQKLYEKAENKRKSFANAAENTDARLNALPKVADADIEAANAAIVVAQGDEAAAQQALLDLTQRRGLAERWARLSAQYTAVVRKLETAQHLFDARETIERDVARLADLRNALPRLDAVLTARKSLATLDDRITACGEEVAKINTAQQQAQERRDAAQRVYDELEERRQQQQHIFNTANTILARLAPDIQKLDRMAELDTQITSLDRELATFPADLTEQIAATRTKEQEARDADAALGWLKQFDSARRDWNEALAAGNDAKNQEAEATAQVGRLEPLLVQARQACDVAQENVKTARSQLDKAEVRREVIETRLARFESVNGAPECTYCGQELTADHLAAEREAIEMEHADAEKAVRLAQDALRIAKQAEVDNLEIYNRCVAELNDYREAAKTAHHDLEAARMLAKGAIKQAQTALGNLPDYRVRIAPQNAAPETYFTSIFPTDDDLRDVEQCANQKQAHTETLNRLEQLDKKRATKATKRETFADERIQLIQAYPPQRTTALRTEYGTAEGNQRQANEILTTLARSMSEAEKTLQATKSAFDTAKTAIRRAQTQLEVEEGKRPLLMQTISMREAEVPRDWQGALADLNQAQLDGWRREAEGLIGADERADELADATRAYEGDRQDKARLEGDMADIPTDARVSVSEIITLLEDATKRQRDANAAHIAAELKKGQLLQQRDERKQAKAESDEAHRKAELYKKLAWLLGRDHLQSHLRQQAEASIVTHANRILARISDQTLRLELRPRDTDEGGKTVKALDLVATNSATGGYTEAVAHLSGSQRFRVAVSLALGIGQYAGQGARPIESVIIDEGFGSLDKDGRQLMIEELRSLEGTLKRIIVVSHQEEFASAFVKGYEFSLVDNFSQHHVK